MEILVYEHLNVGALSDKVDKIYKCLAAGDFQTADVKKMSNGYYRAKLDDTNRLLFQIGKYKDKVYIFVLEVIHNHAYDKSKFLNGAVIDERKLVPLNSVEDVVPAETAPVSYINPHKTSFRLLDKILSFDEMQEEILHLPAPGIIIGSAGSGKTALTLEKLKMLKGNILYITLSPYLVENAGHLYASFGYENLKQEVSFLSFYEYMSSIKMPNGKEADFTSFERWIARYTQSHKIKDAFRIFEEIKGVITGSMVDRPYLSLDDYLALGIKQSIFSYAERPQVYDLFTKYLSWVQEGEYFDSNLVSYELLKMIKPAFDYVIVDEVQDLTNVQLMLILKSLHQQSNFILCGDSNQIVHPNFFSWAQIKTLFYNQNLQTNIIRVLATNYRNTPEVTALANQLLLIKNARFGSIDKESSYLVVPNSNQKGEVEYLENNKSINLELNSKTSLSAKFAVLVLRNEDKAAARKFYNTPLLFSVQEAKGLEYENIILFNTISTYDKEFRELTSGVSREELTAESLDFSRGKDKSDKSLEEYKFYVNSLYVGITRAVKNLYVIETNKKHALLVLLGLVDFKQHSSLSNQSSSKDEWQQEARKLEMQGKQEQADAIREHILQVKPVPWSVTTSKDFEELTRQALNPEVYNRKAKDRFYYYILFYSLERYRDPLARLKYKAAERWVENGYAEINMGQVNIYIADKIKDLMPFLLKYGIDYRNEVNMVPLHCCMLAASVNILDYLLNNGANINLTDNFGRTPLHIMMKNVVGNEEFKQRLFIPFYNKVKPESLKIRINNRLIKINSEQAEFMILNMMLSMLPALQHYDEPAVEGSFPHKVSFQTIDFTSYFTGMPDHVIPEYRCKQAYISGILSKNELNREGMGNKKLFVRLKTGMYMPHPLMEILIDNSWVNIYDKLYLEEFVKNCKAPQLHFVNLLILFRKQLTENPDAVLDSTGYWENIASDSVFS